jgi:hypothetical protein
MKHVKWQLAWFPKEKALTGPYNCVCASVLQFETGIHSDTVYFSFLTSILAKQQAFELLGLGQNWTH